MAATNVAASDRVKHKYQYFLTVSVHGSSPPLTDIIILLSGIYFHIGNFHEVETVLFRIYFSLKDGDDVLSHVLAIVQ